MMGSPPRVPSTAPTSAPVTLANVIAALEARGLVADVRMPAGVDADSVGVLGAAQDSRAVTPGDLFLAWRGTNTDSHQHVPGAVAHGAVAAVVEQVVEGVAVPQIVVGDGRLAAAVAADAVFGSPWTRMHVAAVTGTNGKTTTTALLRHLLAADGPAASLGTLGLVEPSGQVREGTEGLTTPGPVDVARRLGGLLDEGVASVVLEASSHALDQRRLDGVRFDVAVFTNLTQDHLDYHGTMDRYREAKLRLVELLKDGGAVVANAADRAWDAVAPLSPLWFAVDGADGAGATGADGAGASGAAAATDATDTIDGAAPGPASVPRDRDVRLRAHDVRVSADGCDFTLAYDGGSWPVHLPYPGRFNVENALAAAGAALALGQSADAVAARLSQAPPVPGRLEVVVRTPFTVIIDFAHTPDALERVLSVLRPLTTGRLVVVFGAGGDRDRTKRAPMARAVARWADRVWLTSDNPRTEDPHIILDDLAAGLGGVSAQRQVDRRRAIHGALAEAGAGDVVVLAGKGHERYQILGHERLAFDERSVVAEAMAARGGA